MPTTRTNIDGERMNASQVLMVARKLALLLDGEEITDERVRAEILMIAARAEINQDLFCYLATGSPDRR